MTDSDNREPTRSGFGESARQRAIHAYDNARGEVAGAGRKAADSLSEAPLIALAGGLAAGALIAALLPRTAVETKALRPTVKRVRARDRQLAPHRARPDPRQRRADHPLDLRGRERRGPGIGQGRRRRGPQAGLSAPLPFASRREN
jgi:hypothetical protein